MDERQGPNDAGQEAWFEAVRSFCERAYHGDERARDSDEYLSSKSAMLLLSMDAVEQLTPELGLGGLPLAGIRKAARELLASTGAAWDFHTNPKDLPARFVADVAKLFGAAVADGLDLWRYKACPLPGVAACLRGCAMAMKDLVEAWYIEDAPGPTPLTSGRYAQFRLLIQEFVARKLALNNEAVLVEPVSQWDVKLDEALGEEFVSVSIAGALSSYHTTLWLPRVRSEFPQEERAGFRRWYRERLGNDECLSLMIPEE